MSNITQTPSFVFGYWRPWKENSDVFDSYMDYHKDVSLANYTAGAVGSYIQQASEQQVSAINNLAYEIGYGMDVLSSQMEDVSEELRFLNRHGAGPRTTLIREKSMVSCIIIMRSLIPEVWLRMGGIFQLYLSLKN